jgi:hypothetical protein
LSRALLRDVTLAETLQGPNALWRRLFRGPPIRLSRAEVIATLKFSPHLAQLNRVSRQPNPDTGSASRRLGVESTLTRQFELAGKSGARYRYSPLQEDRFLPPAGANFVIARVTAEGATIVFAGETDNLANQVWRATLEKARAAHEDAVVLTRLNVTRAVREAERVDLIEEHQPPMNLAG